MATKLITPSPRHSARSNARAETTCTECEARFSYTPSDVREGFTQGDGRGFGVREYRAVRCPDCRKLSYLD